MAFSTTSAQASLKAKLDPILSASTDLENNLETLAPGVIFGVTNKDETVYLNHSGVKKVGSDSKVNNDTLFSLYSTTKAVAATAVLILVDRGIISLDEPVVNYYPNFSKIRVLKDGVMQEPKNAVTMRHLLTHTSGFGYTIFSPEYMADSASGKHNIFADPLKGLLEDSYLLFEPGTQFSYGASIDWAGVILQHLTGKTLGQFIQEEIFDHLDIKTLTFDPVPSENVLVHHLRSDDGQLIPSPFQFYDFSCKKVDLHMGGQGLFGSVDDYLKFIRLWLNKGKAPNGTQIISTKMWETAIANNLPDGVEITDRPSQNKNLCEDFSATPFGGDKPETWGLSFCRTAQKTATGRPANTLWWSGVGNLYYWIDLENGVGGYYASQLFPCGDPSASNNRKLEKAVYDALKEN